MFSDFLKRLTAPDPAPLGEDDARLALAALLVPGLWKLLGNARA